jgi:hypothetical protein
MAIFAMIVSTRYQYPEHPFCGGMLGAGFPVLFICDDWGGGSPTDSWGKITLIDIPNGGLRPTGFVLDFLFYTVLFWILLVLATRFLPNMVNRHDVWWAASISLGFLLGVLCTFVLFQSSRLYLGDSFYSRSPTPIIPSSTPLGTMPSLITQSRQWVHNFERVNS